MVSARLVRIVQDCASEWESNYGPNDEWRHVMFNTVRILKADSETRYMVAQEAAATVEECLSQRGLDFTDYEGIEDNDQGREEFMAQWTNCLFGEGEGPLDLALTRAQANPVTFETRCAFQLYVTFLNLCYQLERINGEDPIALPVHAVGRRLGVSGATVSAYIKQAVEERYLVQVGKHCSNPIGRGRARTYRFYANRNPTITELMRDCSTRPRTVPVGAMDDD